MKAIVFISLIFLWTFPTLANEKFAREITEVRLYQAIQDLSSYIADTDPEFNATILYREFLNAVDENGLEIGLLRPAEKFLSFEKDSSRVEVLKKILSLEDPYSRDEEVQDQPKPKDIGIVANSNDQCVGQCIRDIVTTAGGLASVGGAVGGPTGAMGAAIVGAALGGVICSTSPQCNKQEEGNKKWVRDRQYDNAKGSGKDIGESVKQRWENSTYPKIRAARAR
jgi:hypothetical protein